MANPEHLAILKQGVKHWEGDLRPASRARQMKAHRFSGG